MKEKNRMPRIEGTRKEIGTGLEPKLIGRQRYRVPPSIASSLAGHFFFFLSSDRRNKDRETFRSSRSAFGKLKREK